MNIKEELKLLNSQAKEISLKIAKIKKECKHKDLIIGKWGSAECPTCSTVFSWYCPTSPTLECDYNQEDGGYDEDCCRYCGQPEERK